VATTASVQAGRTPLFIDKRGDRVKYWNVEHMVRSCAKRAGVTKKISPHSLRHTTITHLLDKGVPLRDVQELAGHENPATTIRYDRGVRNLNNSPVYKITGDFG
jgi:integrase/recombinase XerD